MVWKVLTSQSGLGISTQVIQWNEGKFLLVLIFSVVSFHIFLPPPIYFSFPKNFNKQKEDGLEDPC